MSINKEFFMRSWALRVWQTICGPRQGGQRSFRPMLETLEERSLLDAGMMGFPMSNSSIEMRSMPSQFINNSPMMMTPPMSSAFPMMASTPMQQSNGMMPTAGSGLTQVQIDAFFQMIDAHLITLESAILTQMPQLDGMIQSFNSMVTMVESAIAGHPINDLTGKV